MRFQICKGVIPQGKSEGFGYSAEKLCLATVCKSGKTHNITRPHSRACLLLNYPSTHVWRLVCVNKRETDIAAWA